MGDSFFKILTDAAVEYFKLHTVGFVKYLVLRRKSIRLSKYFLKWHFFVIAKVTSALTYNKRVHGIPLSVDYT